MKVRGILAVVAICAGIIGIWCHVHDSKSVRQVAVGKSLDLARDVMGPSGVNFKLRNTKFLDSYSSNDFYVALNYESPDAGDKLQEVFFFDASGGQPKMEWSYSVLNNLAKLEVDEGTFVDDGNSWIQRKEQYFERSIALTPVQWQFQAETIARLGREGVEILVSLERHPELKPFKIEKVTDAGCLAKFSSMDDALGYSKILGIKLGNERSRK